MIDLITGHQGAPHISAKQISDINNAMMEGYGADKVMRIKDGTITLSNDTFTVNPGYWRVNGYDMEIQETESIQIERTTGNLKRYDDIYVEILRDIPSGAERAELVKVEGTPASSSPSHPAAPTEPELTTDTMLLCIPVGYVYVTSSYTSKHDDTVAYHYVSETEYIELLTHLQQEQYSRAHMSSGNFAPIRVEDIIKLNTKGTWTHTDPPSIGGYANDTYTLDSGNLVFQISSNGLGLKSILVTTSSTSGYTEKLILFKGEVAISSNNLWLPRSGSQIPSGLSSMAIVNGDEYTVGTGAYYVELPEGVLTELSIQATSGISGNTSFYPTLRYEDDPTYTSSYPPAPTNIMLWNEIRSFGDTDANIVTKDYSSVITLDDALGVNAVDVKVKVEPVQAGSGAPSPSNVRAISGWSGVDITRYGKNYLNTEKVTSSSITFTPNSDGYITASPNNSDGRNWNYSSCQYKLTLLAGEYALDYEATTVSSSNNRGIQIFTSNGANLSSIEKYNASGTINFTLSQKTQIGIMAKIYDSVIRMQIRKRTDSSTYEPYQGKDYLINLGGTYYGGEIDVTKGVMKVTNGYRTLPTITAFSGQTSSAKYIAFGILNIKNVTGDTFDCMSSTHSARTAGNVNGVYIHNGTTMYFYFSLDLSVEDYNSQFAGVSQLVYPLQTPYYIDLKPTDIQLLQNQNTLFADSGDIYLEYRPNGIGNIGETLGELQNEDAALVENAKENGCVNLLPPIFTSQVKNGITLVANDDGTVVLNNTASATTVFNKDNPFPLKVGETYKLTGSPVGGIINSTYRMLAAIYYSDSTNTIVSDYGDGAIFTVENKTITRWEVRIDVFNGYTSNNLLFKPMISLASLNLSYNDYVPYSKSNRELTEDTSLKSVTSASHTFTTANQWEYTDVSFTLTRPALVQVTAFWSNDYPYGVAISTSQSSANLRTFMLDTSSSATRCITAYLPAGTYYVWANYHSASTNTIQVQKLIEF